MSSTSTAIPTGSWVLVTGATGFVACHVTRQLLQRGYKVRGTVRDQAKAQWLIDDHFKSYADSGSYELSGNTRRKATTGCEKRLGSESVTESTIKHRVPEWSGREQSCENPARYHSLRRSTIHLSF